MNEYVALGIIAAIFPLVVLFGIFFEKGYRNKKKSFGNLQEIKDFIPIREFQGNSVPIIVELKEYVFYLPFDNSIQILKDGEPKLNDFRKMFVELGEL